MFSITTEASAAVITLDPWDKLLIIASAGLFLLFVLVCIMCVLSPFCWLYHYCPFQTHAPVKGHDPAQGYGSTSTGSQSPPSECMPLSPRMRVGSVKESSEFSDSSGPSMIEMKRAQWKDGLMQKRSLSVPNVDSMDHRVTLLKGSLDFTMKYDKNERKVIVNILKVTEMILSDTAAVISPYVRVRFYRVPYQFFSLSKDHVINNLHIEIRTKMKKHNDNPTFNELFVIPIDKDDLKLYTVKIQLCDLDKYSRHIVLGEATFTLKKLNLAENEEAECSESLQPPIDEDIGDVSIGLNYLPTAEKLYLTIVKIRGLRPMNKQDNTTDAYARVALMFDGRHLKKSKTIIKKGDLNPEFDETFAFDVPSQKLGSVYFRVSLLHAGKTKEEHRLLGRVYIGPNLDAESHAHWMEMIQLPRKQVTAWHKIQG
ncbi:synaptotagmin-A-like isoform X2 [Mytilus edulis]